jgi:phosphohistidine phosphatase SixA
MANDQAIPSNFNPKILYLLRHSDAVNSADNDYNRKLSHLGKDKAHHFSTKFSTDFSFDLVLCSSANRTKETLNLLELKQTEILFYDSLYLAEKEMLLAEIEKVSVSDLAIYLTGSNIHLSTCQMVQIQLETNAWNLLGQETGRIVRNFF